MAMFMKKINELYDYLESFVDNLKNDPNFPVNKIHTVKKELEHFISFVEFEIENERIRQQLNKEFQ